MTNEYTPGPAKAAKIQKEGDEWTLVLTRELRHSPEKVWKALTEPAHLSHWAPFDADASLGTVGSDERDRIVEVCSHFASAVCSGCYR
jgi:hypothetical protein